ncbi:YolD-like family protein [Paenibacillus sp. SC116]|uniref:YolD-like family protein n=1 Tax=Paenibacillus sp. SC116 TaxID=2968986 RepID=UPI00215ACFC1|nr:YolD-like family protein [Paenibacillus sp. SC116]MCR8843063.1 YolD-like family protein [Paenibacillus sp. SC116]
MSKLDNNGLWESSRMMIPQHKSAIHAYHHEVKRKSRPHLDEQEFELIGGRLAQAMRDRDVVTVEVFDPFEVVVIHGQVIDIDVVNRRIRLLDGDDKRWVNVIDVMNIS